MQELQITDAVDQRHVTFCIFPVDAGDDPNIDDCSHSSVYFFGEIVI